jgi:hypothetical protein
VRADLPEGQLRADTATMQIIHSRIAAIIARGGPALFQRPAPSPAPPAAAEARTPGHAASGAGTVSGDSPKAALETLSVRGHADTIDYNALQNLVRFDGNSWFSDGCNEINSQLVIYNIGTQTVQAGNAAGSHERVHGTVSNTQPGAACSGNRG